MSWNNAQALIVGVNTYDHHDDYADLPFTLMDAQVVTSVIRDPERCGYPPNRVYTLTGQDATCTNIRHALTQLTSPPAYDATTFVYFSGHGGHPTYASQPIYLCPREARADALEQTAISGDEFSLALASIQTQRLVVILDTCHANGAASFKGNTAASRHKPGLSLQYLQRLSQGEGRVIIAASREDQLSHPHPDGKMSWFTYYLIKGLKGASSVRGDGLIHMLDLYHYISERMHHDHAPQDPIFSAKNMEMDFPIALDRGGKGGSGSFLLDIPSTATIDVVRQEIMRDPLEGARHLDTFIRSLPDDTLRSIDVDRNEVPLRISELQEVQRRLRLFGSDNPGPKATRSELIYFLLWICTRLERSDDL